MLMLAGSSLPYPQRGHVWMQRMKRMRSLCSSIMMPREGSQ